MKNKAKMLLNAKKQTIKEIKGKKKRRKKLVKTKRNSSRVI